MPLRMVSLSHESSKSGSVSFTRTHAAVEGFTFRPPLSPPSNSPSASSRGVVGGVAGMAASSVARRVSMSCF